MRETCDKVTFCLDDDEDEDEDEENEGSTAKVGKGEGKGIGSGGDLRMWMISYKILFSSPFILKLGR